MLEMSLQVVLAALLLVSIGWSALLHRRLSAMRQGGEEIGRFVADLVGATGQAEAATRQMAEVSRQWQRQRTGSETIGAELRQQAVEAEALVRELRRLVQAAGTNRSSQPPERDDRDPPRVFSAPRPQAAEAPVKETSNHDLILHAIRDLR